MPHIAPDAPPVVRAWMPGAFARLGPLLGEAFTTTSGQPVQFARFRPSGVLAQEILDGAEADVYVSANTLWMRRLQRAGVVHHWSTLARNRLCAIARPDVELDGVADLTRPGLTVVAPQSETDPCGQYVEDLWRRQGLLPLMCVKHSRGELVRSTGSADLPGFLLDGRAQVGVLYVSEARQLDPTQIRTVEFAPSEDLHEHIRFVIAALTSTGQPFVRWLRGPAGQVRLERSGFLAAALGKGSARP